MHCQEVVYAENFCKRRSDTEQKKNRNVTENILSLKGKIVSGQIGKKKRVPNVEITT